MHVRTWIRNCGNQVRAIAGNGVVQQTVAYTAYGQAREVKSTVTGTRGNVTRYYYGPERQRIRRMDFYSATPTGSADVADEIGNAEIITRLGSATRELRRSLGPVILSRMINARGVVIGSAERYLFTDAQGSPHRITSADGTLLANEGSRWFSAFGARAETADGDELTLIQVLNTATDQITRLSYTGHQAADPVGLVHMGGRMYDPLSGRFLQPDPIVQDPSNPQNFNRYTYVFNNPLAWTDPTGYWGAREQGALRTVAAIVIAIYTGVYVNAGVTAGTLSTTQAAAISAAGGAAAGAVQTGTLRGALVGAFSAYVGYQIGSAYVGREGSFGHVVAHATLGGVTSALNGGKFGHGFLAAGFSNALGPHINTGNDFGDGFMHAMVGGTASRLSGGKFANGAVTAAFSFAFNQVTHKGPTLRLSKNNPVNGFETYEEAIMAQQSENNARYLSTTHGEELFGYISSSTFNGDERFSYSDMIVISARFNSSINIPAGTKITDFSHTHPYIGAETNQEGFSPRDVKTVVYKNKPTGIRYNVRTPSGSLRILEPQNVNGNGFQEGRAICVKCFEPHPYVPKW